MQLHSSKIIKQLLADLGFVVNKLRHCYEWPRRWQVMGTQTTRHAQPDIISMKLQRLLEITNYLLSEVGQSHESSVLWQVINTQTTRRAQHSLVLTQPSTLTRLVSQTYNSSWTFCSQLFCDLAKDLNNQSTTIRLNVVSEKSRYSRWILLYFYKLLLTTHMKGSHESNTILVSLVVYEWPYVHVY